MGRLTELLPGEERPRVTPRVVAGDAGVFTVLASEEGDAGGERVVSVGLDGVVTTLGEAAWVQGLALGGREVFAVGEREAA